MSTKVYTVARLNRFLSSANIPAAALADYLCVTRSAISKWRARNVVPRRLHRVLEELETRPRESVLRHRPHGATALY